MKRKSLIVAALTVAALAGCKDSGGGDNGGNNGDNGGNGGGAKLTEQFVRDTIGDITGSTDVAVLESNQLPNTADTENNQWYCGHIGSLCAYEPATGVADDNGIKRYDVVSGKKIPVYYWNKNGSDTKDPRFMHAMSEIQKIILPDGKVSDIFEIHTEMADVTVVDYTVDYTNLPTEGGIIFSVGTSNGNHGNISIAPESQQTHNALIDAHNHLVADKGWIWMNLDNPEGTKIASNDVAVHELAHVFFMGRMENTYDSGDGNTYTISDGHFDGFGIHGSFDERAKAVLKAMYSNPAGTSKDNIVVDLAN